MTLTESEKLVLKAINDGSLKPNSNLERLKNVDVDSCLRSLFDKGLISSYQKDSEQYELTYEGKRYLKSGLSRWVKSNIKIVSLIVAILTTVIGWLFFSH